MVGEAGREWGTSYAFCDGAAFDAYIYGGRKNGMLAGGGVRRRGRRTVQKKMETMRRMTTRPPTTVTGIAICRFCSYHD